MVLQEDSKLLEIWRRSIVPAKLKIHLFNVLNPEAVQQGDKPILEEVGPYIFEYVTLVLKLFRYV